MTLPIFNRFNSLEKGQEPVVKALFEDVIREAPGIRYVSSAPSDVGTGEFVIMDDGTTRRMYMRTGQDTVHYVTLT